MEEKKFNKKHDAGVPMLIDKNSDVNSKLQRKLGAEDLWELFCAKPENAPDPNSNKRDYDAHVKRRKDVRWEIEKTLSDEMAKAVNDLEKPYDVLQLLRKMLVSATKFTLVRQLRSILLMKYTKGCNLITFIEELKDGFTKLENVGLALDDKLKPSILVMVLNDEFDHMLRPYLVQTLAGNDELKFDRFSTRCFSESGNYSSVDQAGCQIHYNEREAATFFVGYRHSGINKELQSFAPSDCWKSENASIILV